MKQCTRCGRYLDSDHFDEDPIYGTPKETCVLCPRKLAQKTFGVTRGRRRRPPGGARVRTRRARADLIAERARARA